MTKRILVISLLVYCAFLLEFVLYNAFGPWGKPALLILVIVFCNLYWGIRFSIYAAVIAGLLKDSFGTDPFGTYLLIYMCAAYLTTIIRQSLYQPGSRFSRVMVAMLVLAAVFVLEIILHMRFFEVRLSEVFLYIFIPHALLTAVAATFVFHSLRDMAVRLKL